MTKHKPEKKPKPVKHLAPRRVKHEPSPELLHDFQTELHAKVADLLVDHPYPKRKFVSDEQREAYVESCQKS